MARQRYALGLATVAWLTVLIVLLSTIFGIQSAIRYRAATFPFSGSGFIVSDPRIGYVGMPNAEMHHLALPVYDVFTNTRGGRDSYRGKEAPANADFLFLGDSYTWGGGVADDQTFAKALSRQLGVPVFNAAVPNYSMVASLLSIDNFSDLSPRYIVYGFSANRLAGIFSPCAHTLALLCRPMVYLDRGSAGLEIRPPDSADLYLAYMRDIVFRHSFGWRDIYWTAYRDIFIAKSNMKRASDRSEQVAERPSANWVDDPMWKAVGFRFLLDRMIDKAGSLNATLILLNLRDQDNYVLPLGVAETIHNARDRGKVLYIDAAVLLQQAAIEHGIDYIRIPHDGHLTSVGHEIVADALAAAVFQRRHGGR